MTQESPGVGKATGISVGSTTRSSLMGRSLLTLRRKGANSSAMPTIPAKFTDPPHTTCMYPRIIPATSEYTYDFTPESSIPIMRSAKLKVPRT